MELNEFVTSLESLGVLAEVAFTDAKSFEEFEAARVQFVGARSGQMKSIQKELGSVASDSRREAGMKLNEVKTRIQTALDAAQARISSNGASSKPSGPILDPTLPGARRHLGRIHPITQTIEHLKEIMGRLGFAVVEGPEVEDTWHNFIALNIPEDHPARDPLDNFVHKCCWKNIG